MNDSQIPNGPPPVRPGTTIMTAATELSLAAHVLEHAVATVGSAVPNANDSDVTEIARQVLSIAARSLGPPPRKKSLVDNILGPNLGPMLMALGQMLTAQEQGSMTVVSMPPAPTPGEGETEPPDSDPPN